MSGSKNKSVGIALSDRQVRVALATVFAVAGLLYALISLVNHYLFKTYSLDLGLYTHAMYDYTHFRVDDCSMFKAVPQSILSDHFDLYLIILSPLVYVFGSYTLLIVQIVAVLLGGWGIHKLITLYTDDTLLPVLAAATFFFSFGIIHSIAFDYHSNVLATMMLPWLLYFFKKGKYALSSLMVVLFVIGKENMSLWLLFVSIGLMWDYRKDRKAMWHLTAYAVFSLVYFFIINMIVMPKLGGTGGGFARYSYLGDSYIDIAKNLLTHPKLTLKLLFTSTIGMEEFVIMGGVANHTVLTTFANPEYAGIKEEFYWCALATGLIFTILKPNYLFMLLPLIGQKMIACQPNFWGISFQYSVEFMPVLVIASFLVILRLKKPLWRLLLSVSLLISIVLTTFYTIGVPKSKVFLDQLCVYQGRHYEQKDFDVRFAYEVIKMIPDEASVCAAPGFVPHLAMRDKIKDFSVMRQVDADYVLITDFYFGYEREGVLVLKNRAEYETVATDGTIYLLRRIAP